MYQQPITWYCHQQGKNMTLLTLYFILEDRSSNVLNPLKFIGVIIDDSLTWKLHIDHICSKASKGIGILRRARQVLYMVNHY